MFEVGIALKAEFGEDKVFDLSLGNPVVEPPEQFNEELRRLAREPAPGMHRYMPNAGYPETRAVVAQTLAAETGLPFSGADIVMSCGAAGAINVGAAGHAQSRATRSLSCRPILASTSITLTTTTACRSIVPTTEDFDLDLAAVESAITPRTRGPHHQLSQQPFRRWSIPPRRLAPWPSCWNASKGN